MHVFPPNIKVIGPLILGTFLSDVVLIVYTHKLYAHRLPPPPPPSNEDSFPRLGSVTPLPLTQHQHGGNNDIGEQGKDAEDDVRAHPEAGPDDLEEGFGSWSTDLELD